MKGRLAATKAVYGPIGLLLISCVNKTLNCRFYGVNTMRYVLSTVALFACFGALSGSFSGSAYAVEKPPNVVVAVQIPERLKAVVADDKKPVRTVNRISRLESPNAGTALLGKDGTLWATLALMGAIALRRRKSGKL